VLKEIGIPDNVFETKYMEVWNKIDLVPNKEEFLERAESEYILEN
jgi:hypothetical protein